MTKAFSVRVIVGAFLLAVAVGAANNVVNPHRVPWTGRPKVLVSYEEESTDPHWKGIRQGLAYGGHEIADHALDILAIGAVVVGVSLALRRLRAAAWSDLAETWFRLAMAAMFAAASYYKLRNPAEFALTVTQYRVLPAPLVRGFALWLPAAEIVVAAGLLFTRRAREHYVMLCGLWLLFMAALAQALLRRLGITCGCFSIAGATTTGEAWSSLLRDVVLLAPTLYFAARAKQRYVWDLWRPSPAVAPARHGIGATTA